MYINTCFALNIVGQDAFYKGHHVDVFAFDTEESASMGSVSCTWKV